MNQDVVIRESPLWDSADFDETEAAMDQTSEHTKKRASKFRIMGGDGNTTQDEHHVDERRNENSFVDQFSQLSFITEGDSMDVHHSSLHDTFVETSLVSGSSAVNSRSDHQSELLNESSQDASTLSLEKPDYDVEFAPRRLLDIQDGEKTGLFSRIHPLDLSRHSAGVYDGTITTTRSTPLLAKTGSKFFKDCSQSLQDRILGADVRSFKANDEVGIVGGAWRGILKRLMSLSHDQVNALLLTRQLQLSIPFQTAYEAYILGQLVEALESGKDLRYTLHVAFRNRNTSRILVQLIGSRYDFVWHWSTMIRRNRPFDAWGQLPLVGFTAFPATENFPNTRNHALSSIARVILGEGHWYTRVITGREGLVTDDPGATSQNLAAESNGFELANRNQYGTYVGRSKTNEFRRLHRLPTDESLLRTFIAQPMATLVNNGVVHVLRQLAKHWHNTLDQQNFAHQRMEQLDPFESLRFHLPIMLVTLSSLRGRNKWDAMVLGPLIKRLQELKPTFTAGPARGLVRELQESIVVNVCGGVPSMVDPFLSWLDAIHNALDLIEVEAKGVLKIVKSVETGIRLGHDLITQVSWKIPNDSTLKAAIVKHIRGQGTGGVPERRIRTALGLITPRDKRTLIQLIQNGLVGSRPAQLLLGRAKTLLQREIRRQILNETILKLSKGNAVTELEEDQWYWLRFGSNKEAGVYINDGKVRGDETYRFVHVDSNVNKDVSLLDESTECRVYVPVGEAIVRAQRAFMNIELDHGKKFAYNAFMEFTYLRESLRKLIVISQITCEELDNARINVLAEVQRSNQTQVSVHDLDPGKTYYTYSPDQNEYVSFVFDNQNPDTLARHPILRAPPQSLIVIGGGPTGLVTAIHCTEAVLASGGVMKLYEARDAFASGGSTFERAQIVRLDARWIAMLRYHLGTGFEDVFIPASGETDSQLGNTLPDQGFVEITIKDLESMLHGEACKMWSKGLMHVFTDSKASYDPEKNSLTKFGQHLKTGDRILRRFNEDGVLSNRYYSWRVIVVLESKPLAAASVTIGEDYGIYDGRAKTIRLHTLVAIDLRTDTYSFARTDGPEEELLVYSTANWPAVYPTSVDTHGEVDAVIVECKTASAKGGHVREILFMEEIGSDKFIMDVEHSHVVEAAGKPQGSKVHFQVTTSEPYGVCCAQGLKVSLGMHNFGEKRWQSRIIDDIRSQTDQNTRIVGDFTKMVRSAPVTKRMLDFMMDKRDTNWQLHFKALVVDADFPTLAREEDVIPKIQEACVELTAASKGFERKTLQTRFFETGDNYYLGMEFPREYIAWRDNLAGKLVAPALEVVEANDAEGNASISRLKSTLMHHIDRLWYDSVLETIRTGDVYNPGARHRVPRLHLVKSHTAARVGSFPVGECFRRCDCPGEMYEVLIKRATHVIVRNVEGVLSRMPKSTLVKRESNLTRGPDGNAESRVALATFPVAHYVNHRSLRINNLDKGYVFAFAGDEQSTPHFMRYSGLTGACINGMLFNNFIKQANDCVPLTDRLREFSIETNWSNGEVVTRGTGSNYGDDGFLRPGFSYTSVVAYLYSKVGEYEETGQDMDNILSRDWKIKLAASLVPRGLETNVDFIRALCENLHIAIIGKFVEEVMGDEIIERRGLEQAMEAFSSSSPQDRDVLLDEKAIWDEFLSELEVKEKTKSYLRTYHVAVAKRVHQACKQVIEHAKQAYLYDQRISSELCNQPKSVDRIVDEFAVEAQNFANSLTMSAAFSAGTLAFQLVGPDVAFIISMVLAVANVGLSFSTMTNSSRYKIRNEEARIVVADKNMSSILKGTFLLMDNERQVALPVNENPFVVTLEQQVSVFLAKAAYYNMDGHEVSMAFEELKSNIHDPVRIHAFMNQLTTKFIVDTYHINSYLQESLVSIYATLEELLRVSTAHCLTDREKGVAAFQLFRQLRNFRGELEGTLQRGPTRWGFVKSRGLCQWDIVAMFKYLYSLICCSTRSCVFPTAPISTKTAGVLKRARYVSDLHGSKCLRREIRDLEELYWATRESDIASIVFMAGFFVFIASFLFLIAHTARIDKLVQIAFWTTLTSAFGALLGTFYLWKKLVLLVKLVFALTSRRGMAVQPNDVVNIGKIRGVTLAQIVFTIARLLSAGAASVALPWSVANNAFPDLIVVNNEMPFWIALAAVSSAIASTLFFFLVEYRVRYNLPTKLGQFVCESFRDEIEEIYEAFSIPMNGIETKQVQEREAWEYTAREFLHRYRFDAVFAADRFGSVLQYLQSGMGCTTPSSASSEP